MWSGDSAICGIEVKKQRKWVNSKNNNDGLCDNSFVFGIHKRNLTGTIKEGGSNAASLIDRRIF